MRQILLILAVLTAGFVTQFTWAQEQNQPAKEGGAKKIIGTIERLDPRFDQLVPKDAQLEMIAEGFLWTEGAAWYKPGKCLLFSDIPNNVVIKWEPGKGTSEYLKPSGYTGVNHAAAKPVTNPAPTGCSWILRAGCSCANTATVVSRGSKKTARKPFWPTIIRANASIAPMTWPCIPTAIFISPIHHTVWPKGTSGSWILPAFSALAARTARSPWYPKAFGPTALLCRRISRSCM